MGGSVAVHVAAARPSVVSLLVMAEASIDADEDEMDGQSEEQFVETGFAEMLAGDKVQRLAQPTGTMAAHVGITRLVGT